jgi:hypothetical protein
MDGLLKSLWDMLTPSIGTLALAAVGIGLLVGLMRKAIDKLGTTPVMLTIGGIVIIAWAVRYIARPPEVEIREVRPDPIVVEKLVPDTSSIDAMKRQLEDVQREKEKLAVMANDASRRASKAEAEVERRDAPKVSAKAAFDEKYAESKVRPTYEYADPSNGRGGTYRFLTVKESRGEYLVTSLYKFSYGPLLMGKTMTISVQDRTMQAVGNSTTYEIVCTIYSVPQRTDGDVAVTALLDGLADGSITLFEHAERVDAHLASINERSEKLKHAEHEYAKRTQRGVERPTPWNKPFMRSVQ